MTPAWNQVTNPVQTNSGVNSVSLNVVGQSMFFRLGLASPTLPETETLAVTVTDANGVSVGTNQSFMVQAVPGSIALPNYYYLFEGTYGCESPDDPISDQSTCERVGWQKVMGTPGAGGGSESFCWTGDSSWPGDYIKPVPPGTLPATPWINGDADFSNWGVNTANIVFIVGDGDPDSFTAMFPDSSPEDYETIWLKWPSFPAGTVYANNQFYQIDYTHSWGSMGPNDCLDWLCGLLCHVLNDETETPVWQRWGPAFGGLHIFTGFASEAHSGGSFSTAFAKNMLGIGTTNHTIVQAWWSATSSDTHDSTPAAMGPVGPNGVFDYGDYYWGKGPVGPTILPERIKGWWYLQGDEQIQKFFP